jgi:hypothetical protein
MGLDSSSFFTHYLILISFLLWEIIVVLSDVTISVFDYDIVINIIQEFVQLEKLQSHLFKDDIYYIILIVLCVIGVLILHFICTIEDE